MDTNCRTRTCLAGVCGVSFAAAGTKTPLQTPRDCQAQQCDGQGHEHAVPDDGDLPDDHNPCTDDVCTGGVPSHSLALTGTACGAGLICDGAGSCLGCLAASDCPGQDSECQTRTCTAGVCQIAFLAAGTAVAQQTPGDCRRNVCDGGGGTIERADDLDTLSDSNDCTRDSCSVGVGSSTPQAAGTPCAQAGGKLCDGAGACVECAAGSDCPSGVCAAGKCADAACQDAVKNGTETATDCGGLCPACLDGQGCDLGADCQSGVCTGGQCQVPACTDGVKNGKETSLDCGGSCPACANGQPCQAASDCQSAICASGICQAASCLDGTKNATETDTDCGGGACAACPAGQGCAAASDCLSGVCTAGLCQAESCTDTVKNGQETGQDCGGAVCASCADGQGCKGVTDCQSGVCAGGVCQAPSCSDGVKNGTETALDCGGGVCGACADQLSCLLPADCQSGVCAAGKCQSPSCTDTVKNGQETDKDCGAGCPACASGSQCAAASDCQSGVCSNGVCAAPACTDTIKNGPETDVDCGGSCPTCAAGQACGVPGDCQSGVCTGGKCQAATCSDGVKNGLETGQDCGGAVCASCADKQGCLLGADCQSGVCTGGLCQTASCTDSVKNGTETDKDCGGSCPPCASTKICKVGGDCQTGVCQGGICQDASCTDSVKNGKETDTDCGGASCARCARGKGCGAGPDCLSGTCTGGVCAAYVVDVQAGNYTTCAMHSGGTIKCWGRNTAGQNGQGDTAARGDNAGEMGASLASVPLGTGRTAASIYPTHGESQCAILDDGSVKCWGLNSSGQLGQGDTQSRGDNAGEMGDSLPAINLGSGRTAVSLSIGEQFVCALLDNGQVKCWGNNQYGQLGQGDTAARGDGPGEMGDSLPAIDLGTGRTAKAVSCGNVHACAILDDDSLRCWGYAGDGRLGIGATGNRGDGPGEMGSNLPAVNLGSGRTAKTISLAANHTCALLDNGTVKCWGYNLDGRLGVGDLINRGDSAATTGDNLAPISLGSGRTARTLKVGANHACVQLDNDAVKCWGWGNGGLQGQGDTKLRGALAADMGDNLLPINLGTGRTAKGISAGSFHNCAILDDDTFKCWGYNNYGQLGQGDLNSRGDSAGEMGDNLPVISF